MGMKSGERDSSQFGGYMATWVLANGCQDGWREARKLPLEAARRRLVQLVVDELPRKSQPDKPGSPLPFPCRVAPVSHSFFPRPCLSAPLPPARPFPGPFLPSSPVHQFLAFTRRDSRSKFLEQQSDRQQSPAHHPLLFMICVLFHLVRNDSLFEIFHTYSYTEPRRFILYDTRY